MDQKSLQPITDDELTALALASDPDAPVADDAVSFWDLSGMTTDDVLPEWYMPLPMGGPRLRRGWRRRMALLVIISFLVIDAYGLCSTYGQIVIA
jgi:hypothetical protein